jgi:hypothetical protein
VPDADEFENVKILLATADGRVCGQMDNVVGFSISKVPFHEIRSYRYYRIVAFRVFETGVNRW